MEKHLTKSNPSFLSKMMSRFRKSALVLKRNKKKNVNNPVKTSSSNEGGRSIKLKLQKEPQNLKIKMLLDQDVKTISDLVDNVRQLIPELRDVKDIQVYQDKHLQPPGSRWT